MIRISVLLVFVLFTANVSAQDSLENAEKLYADGRYSKAVAQFERLITRDGRKTELLMGLGKSLFGLKESHRSQGLFQEVLGQDKKHSGAYYWTGRILARKGLDGVEQGKALAKADLRDAVIFYRDAADCAKTQKEKFEARFAAGQTLMYLLDFKAALAELRLARALEPKNEAVIAHMLGALYRAGEFKDFLELARRRPAELDRLREFDAVLRLGRIDEARQLFIALIEEHGYAGQTRAYDVLSLGCEAIKKPEAHIAILEALVAAAPDEFYALYYLGYAQAIQGKSEEAEETFRAYLKVVPNDWRTTRHLANVQRRLGRLADAEATIRIALDLNAGAPVVREEAANLVADLVNVKEFKRALDLHTLLLTPDADAQTRRGQAILLKENGRLEESRNILQAICDEEEVEGFRLSGFWNDLGLCLKGQKKRQEAEKAFKKAIDVFNFNADAQENLGVLYFEDGRLDEAKSMMQQAIKSRTAEDGENTSKNWRSRYYLKLIKSARIRVAGGRK